MNIELVSILHGAKVLIRNLRRQNEVLQAKVDTLDKCHALISGEKQKLKPGSWQDGYFNSNDPEYEIEKLLDEHKTEVNLSKIKELQEELCKLEEANAELDHGGSYYATELESKRREVIELRREILEKEAVIKTQQEEIDRSRSMSTAVPREEFEYQIKSKNEYIEKQNSEIISFKKRILDLEAILKDKDESIIKIGNQLIDQRRLIENYESKLFPSAAED